ncbi:hypothetical protein [Wenyingzhuangia aestuarii]|uniref:hypothetical protein n=1 Tax=Wenyingzhuangia aestuarii TaxID=1647582 RepID=UPI00143A1DCB|nr:hypothetical protein [Wenyingzhuangia aestuarii]NJB83632.1 hypothetical protein [Wenyingzhuangia aestuarii]
MNGQNLYLKLSKRDYSGSSQDEYAQLLGTLFNHVHSEIFNLLEKAEKLGKKLAVKNSENLDEYTVEDIVLV